MALLQAPLPPSCDVVIIGGGASGTSIAYQLAKRGVDVLLLEATELARGASGRNGGLVDAALDPASPLMEFYLRASASFAGLAEELETDIEYVQDGSLQILLDTDTDIEETHTDFRAHLDRGYPVRWCDRDEVLAMSKLFSKNVIGGWLRYEDGQVNPLLLTYALAEAAARRGAKVRQHTPARGLVVSGERVTAVQTDAGDVTCEQVVVAIEPWSRPFLAALGLDVPVTPQRGQIFVTEPLPPLMTIACLYGNSPNPYIYWRQTRHGSLTIGGCRTVDTHGDWLLGSPGPANSLDIQKMILETIVKVHPGIADVSLIRWWAGVMGFTPDRLPILGRTERYPNLVSAFGFCPNGILCAPLTGRVIADVVTGAEPEVTLEPYRLERFAATKRRRAS